MAAKRRSTFRSLII
jgi:uncharacterized protein